MIYEFDDYSNIPTKHYDICIIGSGPAGASVADTLSRDGYNVCVVESGVRDTTNFADSLRKVNSDGIHIKPHSRERVLGGASTTWAGVSSPLDGLDFETRDWIKHSGWPLSLDDLKPYYKEASERYGFPPLDWFDSIEGSSENHLMSNSPHWNDLDEIPFITPRKPPNFGNVVLDISQGDSNVDLFLGCTVTHLDGDANTSEVYQAVARDTSGNTIEIKADKYVLACGGIENPRILLNSTFACSSGLGNDRDQVGRYFMNHPKGNYGVINLEEPVKDLPYVYGSLSFENGYSGYLGLRVRESIQEEKKILNPYFRLKPIYPWTNLTGSLDDSFEKMYSSISKLPILKRRMLQWVYHLYQRFGPGAAKTKMFKIRNYMEMEPDPENRVVLSEETDAFGMPLPRVRHTSTDLDKRSMVEVHNTLEAELQRSGWGTLESKLDVDIEPWPINLEASHHMGTTRMGRDHSTSVVNEHCRLHYSPNVFIAGSSVFPTGGNANPTYTIVALGIRLGERI